MAELKRKHKAILTVLLTKKCKISAFNFSISDLVAAEGGHHKSYRSSFENPISKDASRGRPPSSDKLTAFNTMCDKMEDECELYTVKDFQEAMQKLGDNVYCLKTTKLKLKERYGDSIQYVNREGRSLIILLDKISVILTESWYDQRKPNQCDEAERIIKTAAKILKGEIKNHTHQTDFYPTIDDIRNSNNDHVPDLLKRCLQSKIFDAITVWSCCCNRQLLSITMAECHLIWTWFLCEL